MRKGFRGRRRANYRVGVRDEATRGGLSKNHEKQNLKREGVYGRRRGGNGRESP